MSSTEYQALIDLSARIGADPALVQAAGGNTSIKDGDTLWVKASGLWLAHAKERDVMVPVKLGAILDAVAKDDPSAEKAHVHVDPALAKNGLRPSIETTVHALMPQKVVVHVHCVETIALAVRADAEQLLADKLKGVAYAFVPYCRPGLPLARAIHARMRPDISVLILGNHGLVVAGETVAEAEALLADICRRLASPRRPAPAPDLAALSRLALDSSYTLPSDESLHGAATDLENCRIAAGGSLYPDHVIFLGPGFMIAAPGESAVEMEDRLSNPPPVLLFPGKGVLVKKAIEPGPLALLGCFVDVASRIPEGARLSYFTPEQNAELLGWDAEKYRQELNKRGASLQ
ncbi:class II aldolase/adducin family protein [Rhizobium sp. FKL33]|uniref:class II aldolase/adducin family protein n=1 Tax=Rhizobium sp. FKL33 TaxID=2562307 RepID=UPI0010C02A53|nr:class II aldolase/adducin family protein [Rhizobium sp. FKL33]